ncbi:MAG: HlyD family efflux transporter periplasmic adaptor subunit [Planctomycetes bacterium]|nr:HlyD family efflux transporter periplasmic adaptor subunit [Planctomycetota bacterium]
MARAPRNIRTPLKQRWRQFRYVCLPYVVFGLTVAATAWLWQQHAGPSGLSGRVTARRGTIAAGVAAEMLPLPGGQLAQLDLNSVVKKGDVIVMFDTSLLEKQIDVAVAELARRRTEITRIEEETRVSNDAKSKGIWRLQFDRWVEKSRLKQDMQSLNRRILDLEAAGKVAQANKLVIENKADDLEKLLPELPDDVDRKELRKRGLTVESFRLQAKALEVEIKEGQNTFAALKVQIKAVGESLALLDGEKTEPPVLAQADRDAALAPFKQAVVVQEKLIEQLEQQKQSYKIAAPFDGKITQVLKWPGQTVEPGELIYLVSAEKAEYITAYVRQGPHYRPEVGDVVDVRLRTRPPRVSHGRVVQVGATFESVPPEHLRNPTVAEWGYPVRIEIPHDFVGQLLPGESVDLTFVPPESDGGGLLMIGTAR